DRQQAPLILNAIPVAQMRTMGEYPQENLDRVGDSDKVPFMGIKGCFAASLKEYSPTDTGVKASYYPVRLITSAGEDPRSRPETTDVAVLFERPNRGPADSRVRIYYDCYGENTRVPAALSRPGYRYGIPFPLLGALDAPIVGYE